MLAPLPPSSRLASPCDKNTSGVCLNAKLGGWYTHLLVDKHIWIKIANEDTEFMYYQGKFAVANGGGNGDPEPLAECLSIWVLGRSWEFLVADILP